MICVVPPNPHWFCDSVTAEHIGAAATDPTDPRGKSHCKAAISPAASQLSILSPVWLEICSKTNSFSACAERCGNQAGSREERKELRWWEFLQIPRIWYNSLWWARLVSNILTWQTWARLPHLYFFLVPNCLSAFHVRGKNGFTTFLQFLYWYVVTMGKKLAALWARFPDCRVAIFSSEAFCSLINNTEWNRQILSVSGCSSQIQLLITFK